MFRFPSNIKIQLEYLYESVFQGRVRVWERDTNGKKETTSDVLNLDERIRGR